MDEARLVGDYVLGPIIGSGSFAVVWRASHRSWGSEVAVKEIDKKLLSPIDHPKIIRFYGAIEDIDLILEDCGGGDLAGCIHRHGKDSEHVARHFMRQLAAGLLALQEKHLIHRDLRPQLSAWHSGSSLITSFFRSQDCGLRSIFLCLKLLI